MFKTLIIITFTQILMIITSKELQSHRESRFWPVGIVRFQNGVCQSVEGFLGTCYTRSQCSREDGGFPSGTCANRIGVCCVYQVRCGETASFNNTYFTNSGFPNTLTGAGTCSITIRRCNSNICQVRLDFLNLNLAQPDGNGNCVTDSLTISGAASNIQPICGEGSGQHVYLGFNGDTDIRLTISTSALSTLNRAWNIRITQLACDCPSLAPTGCLMYYTALTGTVNSFNYGPTLSGNLITIAPNMTRPGTRQLVNQNYGVCVQMQAGYCGIEWSQGPDSTSFTVSGNTALDMVLNGLPSNGMIGQNCTTDYVVIPNPFFSSNGSSTLGDRFCGNQFPTVTSYSKPFVLTVITNGDEMTAVDIANRGFSLNYRQVACNGVIRPTVSMMIGK